MARRRWIADRWDETSATLTGTHAAHLARVLRATAGMRFEVVAGSAVWLAEVATVREDEVRFALLEEVGAERALPLTLLLAVFKFDRLEWAIEKTTELGVTRIVPVLARRTEKHLAQAAAARVARWRRIAEEAAQQSRRADVPEIGEPVALTAALPAVSGVRLLLDENERERSLMVALDEASARESSSREASGESYALAIGPEGGWTDDERARFGEAGWMGVSLGSRILRAETAAMAATAVCSAVLG